MDKETRIELTRIFLAKKIKGEEMKSTMREVANKLGMDLGDTCTIQRKSGLFRATITEEGIVPNMKSIEDPLTVIMKVVAGEYAVIPDFTTPRLGQKYYYVDAKVMEKGQVVTVKEKAWMGDTFDRMAYHLNNCFKEKERAEMNMKEVFFKILNLI